MEKWDAAKYDDDDDDDEGTMIPLGTLTLSPPCIVAIYILSPIEYGTPLYFQILTSIYTVTFLFSLFCHHAYVLDVIKLFRN